MRVAFGLQLLSAEPDKLLLYDLVLMRDSAGLFLCLVPLVAHSFDV